MEKRSVIQKLPRVLVGICAGSTVDSFFASTYQNALVGHGELFYADQIWPIGHITDDGRNVTAKVAIEKEFDYVFFMDSDMLFPKGTLARLLTKVINKVNNNEPIMVVGGLYNTRGDHRVNVYKWRDSDNSYQPEYFDLNSGMHKTDAVATGCLLVDVEVFKKMEFPYFEYWYTRGPKSNKDRWSEDIVFAHKCMKLGIPHYVDTDVVCKHLHNVAIEQIETKKYQIQKMDGEFYEEIDFTNGHVAKGKYI